MTYGFFQDIVAALRAESGAEDHRGAGGLCGDAADEIEKMRLRLGETAKYLDDLQNNMLRNDVDMLLDRCKAPEIVASELRALAGIPEPSETKE